jgi:3-deoxy-manno-octulosonate cytidylyltransferase (CMP-KDO synthetase)
MVRRVYEQCMKSGSLTMVYVATDNREIYDHVSAFKGNVIMTSEKHRSGTERCREAAEKITWEPWDAIINIQGDEPFISPDQIDLVANMFNNRSVGIATLARKISDKESIENPNVVKVVFDNADRALYFSRSPIPDISRSGMTNPPESGLHFKHLGIYGYRLEVLKRVTELEPHPVEQAESLEQLRWLMNGFPIHVAKTNFESVSVDTPEDLSKFTNKS